MQALSIRRALISVSDKAGLVGLVSALASRQVEIVSTGGTAKALAEAGFAVTDVASLTGFPEMLDGRVKTLHPHVHGGILFRRDLADHAETARHHGIQAIDLVVVNLYPFEKTVARADVSWEEAIEQIDIGGPAMVRSAAKNHDHVAILTSPEQYPAFLDEFETHGGGTTLGFRQKLAHAAFSHTASYDRAIEAYLARTIVESPSSQTSQGVATPSEHEEFPEQLKVTYERAGILRYGENPHQRAAVYREPGYLPANVLAAEKRHGKELSYNNLLDLDAALEIVRGLARPAAVVIKHTNPCGAAAADSLRDAFEKAHAGDPVSAFGSILGFNRTIDRATAEAITEPGRFIEAIIAPDYEPEAWELLTTRPSWRNTVRLLAVGELDRHANRRLAGWRDRSIEGGLLRQSPDIGHDGFDNRRLVTEHHPTPEQLRDLRFAWHLVAFVKSNAIVLVREEALVGVGAGQMSRVDSVHIAVTKAGDRARGSVLASDAFFPFDDGVRQATEAGVRAIVQPGGSKRDQESINAANAAGIPMLFTDVRHFRH